jgi:hypothetical protein
MVDDNDLKESLQKKTTAQLQNKIKNGSLTESATQIAKSILISRSASIPEQISKEMLEKKYKDEKKKSNHKFLLSILVVCLGYIYGHFTGLFQNPEKQKIHNFLLVNLLELSAIWGWDIFGNRKNK